MAGVSTVLPSPVAPKDRMSKTVFELGSLVAFARPANPLRATPAKPVPAVFRNPRRGLLSDRMGVRVRAFLPGLKPTLFSDHIGTAAALPFELLTSRLHRVFSNRTGRNLLSWSSGRLE